MVFKKSNVGLYIFKREIKKKHKTNNEYNYGSNDYYGNFNTSLFIKKIF